MDQFQPLWIWHRSRGYLWFLWYVASEGYDWMLWIFLFQTVACVSLMSIFSQKSWFFVYWGFFLCFLSLLMIFMIFPFPLLSFPFFFFLCFFLICLWWTARLPALRSQRRKEHVRLVVEIVKFRERDDISNKTSFACSYNDSFMPSTSRTNRLWTLCCNRNIDAKTMLCVLCFCSKRIISMHSWPTIQRQLFFGFLFPQLFATAFSLCYRPTWQWKSWTTLQRFWTLQRFTFCLFIFGLWPSLAAHAPCMVEEG